MVGKFLKAGSSWFFHLHLWWDSVQALCPDFGCLDTYHISGHSQIETVSGEVDFDF